MEEYLLIFRNEKMEGPMPSAEQMQSVIQHWQSWITGIVKQGNYSGTNRLLTGGKTIKPGNIVTDGPYTEGKEMVGGYLLVKANSFDEAMEMAKSCPNLAYGGNVEIRPVMAIDSDPNSTTFLQEKTKK